MSVLPGDSGHLSYGRSQASLGAGTLFTLLTAYCERPDAEFSGALRPFLATVERKDFTLDQAGNDPAMRAAQDNFFDQEYFLPACRSAAQSGDRVSARPGHRL